jgi:hypothetical protein
LDKIDFKRGINFSALERKAAAARVAEEKKRGDEAAVKQWELENYRKALDFSWPPSKPNHDANLAYYPASSSEPFSSSPRFVYRKRTPGRKFTN